MSLNLNFKRISEKEGLWLEQPFTVEEIRDAIWSYDDAKALGPDGFSMCFFKKNWHLVRKDLVGMMSNFFFSGKLEKSINSSFIAFIPTTESPIEIYDF